MVNSTAKLRDTLKTQQIETDLTVSGEANLTPDRILYHAALILRSERKDCNTIEIQPLDPVDIRVEKEEQITPHSLPGYFCQTPP